MGNYLDTHFNFTVRLDTCRLGMVFNPPTKRSLGIAIRPSINSERPYLKFYIPEDLMIAADFYIGDRVTASINNCASHVKVALDPDGYMIFAAANQPDCLDYDEAVAGTQYPSRFNAHMTPQVIERFRFEDKCTTFMEASRIQKGKYILVPLDDLPIWPV